MSGNRVQINQPAASSSMTVDDETRALVYLRQETKSDGTLIRGPWGGTAQTTSGTVGWVLADYIEPISAFMWYIGSGPSGHMTTPRSPMAASVGANPEQSIFGST